MLFRSPAASCALTSSLHPTPQRETSLLAFSTRGAYSLLELPWEKKKPNNTSQPQSKQKADHKTRGQRGFLWPLSSQSLDKSLPAPPWFHSCNYPPNPHPTLPAHHPDAYTTSTWGSSPTYCAPGRQLTSGRAPHQVQLRAQQLPGAQAQAASTRRDLEGTGSGPAARDLELPAPGPAPAPAPPFLAQTGKEIDALGGG